MYGQMLNPEVVFCSGGTVWVLLKNIPMAEGEMPETVNVPVEGVELYVNTLSTVYP